MFNNFKTKKITKLDISDYEENINEKNINKERIVIKKQNPLFRLLKLLIWIFIIILFFIYKWYSDFKTDILIEKEIVIKVEPGDTYIDLSNKLNLNKNYFKIYLKKNNPDFELLVWNFKISENSNIEQILLDLENPLIEDEINITILEWWNIFDTDEHLTEKWLIKKWEYINYIENLDKINKLTEFFPFIKWLSTLEWYLYPDTYKVVSNNFKINVFVIKQLENFENKVYKKILSGLKNKEIEELLILSSIVEKEEKNINEKSTVAWILKKRLENWWKIWADITVCYPHKLTANECKLVITKYINEKSEYNTRTMTWLPKTPIWSPSFETINATLNSKETFYWFYLHDTVTWKIYYWKNNTEHESNKRNYLR
jgi:UPF0755 protein